MIVLLAAISVIISSILAIAVAFDIKGLANKLSGLPGVKPSGGMAAGLSIFVLLSLSFGTVIGGTALLTGAELPIVDGSGERNETNPTLTPTESPVSTAVNTPTTTSTSTQAQTSTPTFRERNPELDQFERNFRERMSDAPGEIIETPVLATEYQVRSNGSIELWFVFDEIEPETSEEAEDMRTQWHNIAVGYGNAVGENNGREPDRLVVVGLNEKFNNTHFMISTEEGQAAYNGELNETEYTNLWWNRMSGHDEDAEISQYARKLVEEGIRTPTDSRDE